MNEDINRRYYASHAPGREDYWKKMAAPRFRAKVILNALHHISFKSLVDLGCGSGFLLEEVSRLFPSRQYCGVDFSSQQIEKNRAVYPEFDWCLFDLDKTHSPPENMRGIFDVALCSEVIEHLDNPEYLLSHARQMTKLRTGMLILTTQSGRVGETERRVGHKRHFTKQAITSLLEKSGWEVQAVWNAGFPFHDFSKLWANRNADRMMERFSEKPYGIREEIICWLLRISFLFNSNSKGAQLFAVAKQK